MWTLRGGAAAVLALVAGTACGGGDPQPLSATEFRDRANGICRQLERENERSFKGIDRADEGAMARASEELGRRTAEALDDLRDLEGPEASEAGRDRFLARTDEVGDAIRRQNRAATGGDVDAVRAAEDEVRRRADEAAKAARDAGFEDCAG